MQHEEWLPIEEFQGYYEINKLGEVRSLHKRTFHKLVAKHIDTQGYYHIKLSKQGKRYTRYLHRLLAEAYIPKPEGKNIINHIDANKLNNEISNLEWCTTGENIRHAFKLNLVPRKAKRLIDTCSGEEFSGVKEAAKVYGLNPSTLRNYLSGNIKTNPTCLEFLDNAA